MNNPSLYYNSLLLKTQNPFKIGDLISCIESTGIEDLKVGTNYRVVLVKGNIIWLKSFGFKCGFHFGRFKHASNS